MNNEADSPSLERALRHHRDGEVEIAAEQYCRLLQDTPNDANIMGLAGIVELQRGNVAEAERKLRWAISEKADPIISLRNLNSLVVLLLQAERLDEINALIAQGIPDPAAAERSPEPGELGAMLSFAEALIKISCATEAIRLLGRLPSKGGHEARLLELIGRAQMAAQNPAAAIEPLERACTLAPASEVEPRIALGVACHKAGQAERARRIADDVAQTFPLYVAQNEPGHEETLLVINRAPRLLTHAASTQKTLHFRANFISQAATELEDRYRFMSVFPFHQMPDLLPRMPRPDLVINNLAVPEIELGSEQREALLGFLSALQLPVINHPTRMEVLTREAVAALISDCPGVRVPLVRRMRGEAARSAAFGNIPRDFPFPAILRESAVNSSSTSSIIGKDTKAFLARNPSEAAEWIGYRGLSDFYMIEFVNLERRGGVFRRLRAMVMDHEIAIHSVGFYDHWLVGGWRIGEQAKRFYDSHPHCIEEGGQIIATPKGALGREPLTALRRLRERVPLEMFGVDFDIDAEGRVVVFEVSPAMIFLPDGKIPESLLPLSLTPGEISAAFSRLVRRHTAFLEKR